MTPEIIKVSMAESSVAGPSALLCCTGLGSCVGLALYDPVARLAGLAHVMLPDSKAGTKHREESPYRYGDLAAAALVREMVRRGADKSRIFARLVGGANMFVFAGKSNALQPSIGERNLEAVRRALAGEGIAVKDQDSGGNYGRSIEFDSRDGYILIRSAQYGLKWI